MKEWQLQEAKARFSEVVAGALEGNEQVVTKRGEKAVVVMAYEKYRKLGHGQKTLLEVFSSAPDVELNIQRDKIPIKPFKLQ
jgi:prevent-host-death family protein